jgi:hypothetical protein
MVEESVFRGVIEFFGELGVYDVILPFLLVFTIVFAILEKTRVLGTEVIEGKKYSKKNLNAIIGFVIAFLVVASTKLVAAINQAMANIILLLLVSFSFLLLVGSFLKETEEGVFLTGAWRILFMIIMFVGIIIIFLGALDWWVPFWEYLVSHYQTNLVAALILIVVILFFMWYVIRGEKHAPSQPPKTEK